MSSDANNQNESSEIGKRSQRKQFATTSWSMVVEAGGDSAEQKAALSQLCEIYWYPLYAYARRRGNSVAESEDLTQAFFAELLEKDKLASADQTRGRFRTFLLAALDNFLKNDWRSKQTQKRGGGLRLVSLDFNDAENRYQHEPAQTSTAEKLFERNWAITVLNQVLEAVRQQYIDSGKGQLFETLKGNITGDTSLPYEEVAEQLNMKQGAVKVAVHRMRERYGQQLRLQIARTVESPEQVDVELRELFKALSA